MRKQIFNDCKHLIGDEGIAKAVSGKCPKCSEVKAESLTEIETQEELIQVEPDEVMVSYGGEIKADEDGHIRGYLVQFSTAEKPDDSSMRDYFTKSTDFGFKKGEKLKSPVWFHHTLPIKTKNSGTVRFTEAIGESTLEIDDSGVLVDAIITNTKYKDAILANFKALGWSSGVPGHLTERVKTGTTHRVKRWILGTDASLTPNPADKRNRASVMSVKSLEDEEIEFNIEAKSETAASQDEGSKATEGEINMTKEEIDALVKAGVKSALDEKATAEAAVKAAEEKAKAETEARKKEIDDAVKSAIDAIRGGSRKPAGEVQKKTPIGGIDVPNGDTPALAFGHWLKTGDASGIRADADAYKEAGIGFGSDMKTTYSLVEGTQYQGQEVVPTEVAGKIYERRDKLSIARMAGAQVVNASSNVLVLPIEKNNPEKFVIAAEVNTYDQLTQQPLDKLTATVYNFTKSLPMSNQVLDDSVANLEQWWNRRMARAIAETENYYLVSVGTGSGQPGSALVGSTLGVTAASQTVVTAGECISLYHALSAQYRDNVVFVMRSAKEGLIRNLTSSTLPFLGNSGTNGAAGQVQLSQGAGWLIAPNTRVFNDENMPASTTGLKTMLVGNFEAGYVIVERKGLTVLRDPYGSNATSGQVNFVAGYRQSGGVVDATAFYHLIQA